MLFGTTPSLLEFVSSWTEVVVEVLVNLPTKACWRNLQGNCHRFLFSSTRKKREQHREKKDSLNNYQISTGKEKPQINDSAKRNFIDCRKFTWPLQKKFS
jgi:hypothetical protein